MKSIHESISAVVATDAAVFASVAARLDDKTKPRKSLGRLETLACRVAAIQGTTSPRVDRKAIVVMGADHGVAREGVSAYPQEVTGQMLLNFARGGAAINVLARRAGAQVVVVDMGVAGELAAVPEIRDRKVALGTASMTKGPAMRGDQLHAAIEAGIAEAHALADDGVNLIGIGEMGIGNTTSASAITAVFAGLDPAEVTGRGTGVDDEGWQRKVAAIRTALSVNRPRADDALDVLAKVGGFELAGLCGVALGAASRRVPIMIDGFITGAAAWAAVKLCPAVADYLIASHRSVEAGHTVILRALDQLPLLDLDLRLGEGTGTALAMPLVDAALAILDEMATFSSAQVSDSGA